MNLNGFETLKDLPLWLLIALPIVLLAQSTWLFVDARKRTRLYWFWGIWGLIQTPMPLVLYVLIYRVDWRRGKDAE